jgi:catechol 2,3-dioxygenase-like lactoylglutathione lyase family enzyme
LGNYTAVLAVSDLSASIAFYVDKLGFTRVSDVGSPPYGVELQRDHSQILTLISFPAAKVGGNSIATLVFRCREIDTLFGEFLSRGIEFEAEMAIGNKGYGMREFSVRDPDGYVLFFQQPLGMDAKSD